MSEPKFFCSRNLPANYSFTPLCLPLFVPDIPKILISFRNSFIDLLKKRSTHNSFCHYRFELAGVSRRSAPSKIKGAVQLGKEVEQETPDISFVLFHALVSLI